MVRDIETVKRHGIELYEGMEMIRIGIFLSVLDVHVNRAPCTLRVEYRRHRPGRHLDARKPHSSRENEAVTLAGTGRISGQSIPVAVRQISGAVARRIVCDAQPGDVLEKGRIYGMIKFGSRTELFFPADGRMRVLVKEGQQVLSGTSILARLETTES
jgi:phosphatidylserine decarboxylase